MLNKEVFVRGAGVGTCIEQLCDMVLVQFARGLCWVDLRVETVEVVS